VLKIVDVSQWNVITDWALLKESCEGILIKSSQGIVEDPTFRLKFAGSKSNDMRVGIWHFYQPDMDWKIQADAFLKIYNSLPASQKPPWIGLDCEESAWVDDKGVKHTDLPPSVAIYSAGLAQWLITIVVETKITPTIYTRASWWNQWVTPGHWNIYPLWVAHYGVVKPTLPRDWAGNQWQFWQWGESQTPGIKMPVDSDWFDGTEEELDVLFGIGAVPITPAPVVPTPPPLATILFKVEITAPTLNKRTGPGTKYPVVAQLKAGDQVNVTEIAGDSCWFRDADGNFFAAHYMGENFVEVIWSK
jgi:GH25 family lysozyme M1 (1,4-beta-N-acetylmuramidase)